MIKRKWGFDLDGTVICSMHRALQTDSQADFLADWVAHTPMQILADKLLPLGKFMRRLIANGEDVFICTARNMSNADYMLLELLGIDCKVIISRANGDNRQDAIYKASRLKEQFGEYLEGGGEIIFWDDKQDIRETLKNDLGIICVDPQIYNGVNNDTMRAITMH
jgi:hypothetical protein